MTQTKARHATAPDPNQTGWPAGIPYIIGNEGCERFSYYGMNAILYVYVVALLVSQEIEQNHAADLAISTVHLFKTGVYALPMIGAIIADRLLGKYRTILWLSLVYCGGHAVLSLTEGTIWGLYLGLSLIAIGSGGIKPCVSAHVGDQFGKSNWNKLEKVYQAFYFIVNFGSFFATILIPLTREWFGWSIAFAIPGVLMFLATLVFWTGRNTFVHVPPKPGGKLGLLDTFGSGMLFMTVGSLFFTATLPWWAMVLVSAGCLATGLVLFRIRQQIQEDEGFLAVLFFSLGAFIRGGSSARSAGDSRVSSRNDSTTRSAFGSTSNSDDASRARSDADSGAPNGNGPIPPTDSDTPLARHWFFGPAVKRFGLEVAEGPLAVLKISSVFFLVSIFWALFDQHSSSWIRQAEQMDRVFNLPGVGSFEMLASQVPSTNPILVMLLIPFLSFLIFPAISRIGLNPTPLRKMTLGMLIAGSSFAVVALIQTRLDAGVHVHVIWQLLAYILLTSAEVLVSVTGLEFAYTQAPRRMKSTVMGLWQLTVSLGNVLVALLARFSGLAPVNFFWLFAAMMGAAGVLFGIRAAFYQTRDYSQ